MSYLNHSYKRVRIIDLTFSSALLLLAAMLVLAYHIRIEVALSNKLTEHSYEVIMSVDQLNNSLLQAESSRRGYVLTGNPQEKARCLSFSQRTEDNFQDLKKLTLDNGSQQGRLNRLQEYMNRKLTIFRLSLNDYDRKGFNPDSQAQFTEEGSTLMGYLRNGIQDIKIHEKGLLAVRRAEEQTSLMVLTMVILSGMFISFILLSLSYYIARRETRNHVLAADELESANRDISDLSSMTQLLQTCSDFEEARSILASYGHKFFSGDSGGIYLINPSRTLMSDVAVWGNAEQAPFTPDQCWALRLGQPHISATEADVRCQHVPETEGAHLCIPLSAHHETLGTLDLNLAPGITGAELEKRKAKAAAFAEQVALAIRSLQLREQLRELSIRDPLTGLLNRRHMEESLLREISRATRTKQPLSVLMMDVDLFKHFNDTYGHEAGDHVLKEFGHLLQNQVRESDIACRFGGEEFTLILPEADCDTASEIGNRIRSAVMDLQLVVGRQPLGRVTISGGIAVFPEDGDTIQQLLARSDEALYVAKKNGRNRIEGSCAAAAVAAKGKADK
ncbi:GGDEF domain-containing protein [Geomonas terrae]|uniref:diguanylate cyclase n=1 Tax=Geomonas terrae TaxID=2562681 RepID=A0A4S1CGZ2_9BACT|nr:GGDEF domain-containing protein [Geomonas terrae]TGU72643.1 GGDEF domain-containing protein [Geomonas terrae]